MKQFSYKYFLIMKIKMKGTICTIMNRKSAENNRKKGGKNQIIYFRKILPYILSMSLTNLQSVKDSVFFSYRTVIFIYIYYSCWWYLQPDVWKRKLFPPLSVPKRLLTLNWRKLVFRHNSLASTKNVTISLVK